MTNENIIMMNRRQFGLNCQMRILGKNPQVYDFRTTKKVLNLREKDYSPELWFTEGMNKNYSFIEASENPIVVSAYFGAGYFHYSCMGERDSDTQYVAFRTNLKEVDKLAEEILEKGGEKIILGQVINPRRTIDFALNHRNNLEQKIQAIVALPKEEQEKEIKKLLGYEGN